MTFSGLGGALVLAAKACGAIARPAAAAAAPAASLKMLRRAIWACWTAASAQRSHIFISWPIFCLEDLIAAKREPSLAFARHIDEYRRLVSRFRSSLHLAAHSMANFGIERTLEPISKLPEEDEQASELDEAEEVLRVELPSDQEAAAPLNPGEEAFDQPAPSISAEPATVLGERLHPV